MHAHRSELSAWGSLAQCCMGCGQDSNELIVMVGTKQNISLGYCKPALPVTGCLNRLYHLVPAFEHSTSPTIQVLAIPPTFSTSVAEAQGASALTTSLISSPKAVNAVHPRPELLPPAAAVAAARRRARDSGREVSCWSRASSAHRARGAVGW